MTKLRRHISLLVFVLLFILCSGKGQVNYRLHIKGVDRDSAFLVNSLGLQTVFPSQNEGIDYVGKLQALLRSKGYITASLDNISFDTASTSVTIFLGETFQWAKLDVSAIDPALLQTIGWREQLFEGRPMDFKQVNDWQEKILNQLENTGYPFARVYVDSLQMQNGHAYAKMKVDRGPLYHIDSIRVYGDVKISNEFLQRYLDIKNASIYDKQKLQRVGTRIAELSYVEEERSWNLTMLGTGSVLNLYLKPRRSSQVNVLVGFLPNSDQSSRKLLITGEATINLKNALGSGETIGVNWQQLQVKSPRLNLVYQHPFLFNSPLGLDFAFDMFRKDSSFLNVNLQLGAQYILSTNQSGKLFIQRFQTIVNNANTPFVLQNRRLPDAADVSSFNVGVDYEFNNTDYRLAPRKGNEFRIITSAGSKKIKRNNEILQLEDPGDPGYDFGKLYDTVKLKTYQFRMMANAAKYFPLGRQSVIRTAVNGAFFQSGNTFRNELFQVGGYKLLRGFDEQSEYLSHYALGSLEYRLLFDANSYFFAFTDGGWGRNNSQNSNVNYTYIGTGLGLALETKNSVFNIALAIGKRNDTELNLRKAKIHFGFANYF